MLALSVEYFIQRLYIDCIYNLKQVVDMCILYKYICLTNFD